MRRFAAFLLGLCLSWPAAACINDGLPTLSEAQPNPSIIALLQSVQKGGQGWRQPRHEELLRAYDNSPPPPSYDANIQRSALLIYAGKVAEAVDLLVETEAKYPGRYETASNLGTALELSGDNVGALKWIAEGIIRSPQSHQGSEWLHVRILKAKIALAADPRWLESHSVSGAEVGQRQGPPVSLDAPLSGNLGELVHEDALSDHLFYQLSERLKFLPPTDPVVSELLMEYVSLATQREVMAMDDQQRLAKILSQVKSSPRSAAPAKIGWLHKHPIPDAVIVDWENNSLGPADVAEHRANGRHYRDIRRALWSMLVVTLVAQLLASWAYVKVLKSKLRALPKAVLALVFGWTVLGLAVFVFCGIFDLHFGGPVRMIGVAVFVGICLALLRWTHWVAPPVARPLSATLIAGAAAASLGSLIPGGIPMLSMMIAATYCFLVQLIWSIKLYGASRG